MKKFFYSLFMMAVSMIALVSCSSDDDDNEVSPKEMVGVVMCGFSQDALDFYTIKMTATGANGVSYGTYTINDQTSVGTDDNGAKLFAVEFSVKELPVKVTFDATCSKKPSDFVKDQKYTFIYGAMGMTASKKGEGYSKVDLGQSYLSAANTGEKWASIKEGDMTYYEDFAKAFRTLTADIK